MSRRDANIPFSLLLDQMLHLSSMSLLLLVLLTCQIFPRFSKSTSTSYDVCPVEKARLDLLVIICKISPYFLLSTLATE